MNSLKILNPLLTFTQGDTTYYPTKDDVQRA